MYGVLKKFRYFFAVIFLIASLKPANAIEGDIELLKLIADGYEANKEKIRTWGGSVDLEYYAVWAETANSNREEWKRLSRTEFLIDNDFGANRWDTRLETIHYNEGREKTREKPSNYSGIIKSDQGYQMVYDSENEKKIRTLEILPPKDIIRTEGTFTFDPVYVWENVYPVSEMLRGYYKDAHKPTSSSRTIVRQGDIVTFEVRGHSETPGQGIVNRCVFDLSKGCNLVEFVSIGQGIEGRWKLDYEKIGDVFVVKEMSRSLKSDIPGQEHQDQVKATIINKFVNKPVDAAEFEFDKIGLRPGDRITDRMAGNIKNYEWKPTIDGSEALQDRKMPGNTPEAPKDENVKEKKAVNVPEIIKDKNDKELSGNVSSDKPFYKSMGVIIVALVIIAGLSWLSLKSVRR